MDHHFPMFTSDEKHRAIEPQLSMTGGTRIIPLASRLDPLNLAELALGNKRWELTLFTRFADECTNALATSPIFTETREAIFLAMPFGKSVGKILDSERLSE